MSALDTLACAVRLVVLRVALWIGAHARITACAFGVLTAYTMLALRMSDKQYVGTVALVCAAWIIGGVANLKPTDPDA